MVTGNSWSNSWSWSVENWYGRGSAKTDPLRFIYHINNQKIAADEMYSMWKGSPRKGSPQIGDISEEDIDKLLKV